MKPNFCVAITGGIGSGKTTATRFFEAFGCCIISADAISRAVIEQQSSKAALRQIFGSDIFTLENNIDRKKLAQIIFNDHHKKKQLEALLHPKIRQEIIKQIQQPCPSYYLIEIPLLKQRTDYPYVDRVICITSDKQKQIERTVRRDHKNAQEIENIIGQQITNETRIKLADDHIDNNAGLSELKQRCLELHLSYLKFIPVLLGNTRF